MTLLLFILILVVLILVHEFGHFIVAKLFGIRVDEFGIFFPPRVTAVTRGETTYSLNWLPFGGFVRIFGESAGEGGADSRSFANQPRLVQAAVVVAGIACNLLFAWLVLGGGYLVGLPTSVEHRGFGTVIDAKVMVVNVLPGSPAEKAGLAAGDIIESVETGGAQETQDADAAATTEFISAHQEESLILMVDRDGVQQTFLAKAAADIVPDKKVIGVELDDVGILRLPPHLALIQGAILGWDITRTTASGLMAFFVQLFTGTANLAGVAGPIGITAFGAAAIKQGVAAAIVLTALISINLALINIIPIPGLDGGRLLIIAVEALRGRPLSPGLLTKLTMAGFALLIALMVIVSYHDIARLVG